MAHMQENPQTAGKDTRMPTGGETRQMPLRADRPAQAAQAPYPLQGRPAPTQRVASMEYLPSGEMEPFLQPRRSSSLSRICWLPLT